MKRNFFTYYLPTGDWPLRAELYHNLLRSLGGRPGSESSDLLVLAGGSDWGIRHNRDMAEFDAYQSFLHKGNKILGICRGAQLHCIFSGGELIAHLPDWKDIILHTTITGNWLGQSAFHGITNGKEHLIVNSRHHQGFTDIPESNTVWRSRDGLAEGGQDEKCFWVQWHPEHEDMFKSLALQKYKEDFYEWF